MVVNNPCGFNFADYQAPFCESFKVTSFPLPPQNISVYQATVRDWKPLSRKIMRGTVASLEAVQIQARINDARLALQAGQLQKEFDWARDLSMAENYHVSLLDWAERDGKLRNDWAEFWQSRIKDNAELTSKLVHDGLKFILIVHGAAAIAAFNGLLTASTDRYRTPLITAMFGAIIGLALAALGQITIIETVSAFSERIKGRLVSRTAGFRCKLFIGTATGTSLSVPNGEHASYTVPSFGARFISLCV